MMFYKLVFSIPVKENPYTRATIIKDGGIFQASLFTQTQVFHKNLQPDEVQPFIDDYFGKSFKQYHAWDGDYITSARITKKGKILTSRVKDKQPPPDAGIKKQKKYILKEGDSVPVLRDMGIFTHDGKVVASMRDKFRQINRFLELLSDEIPSGQPVNIIDFGCGKSYLTFLIYHYFTEIRKQPTTICGLDIKADVVTTCAEASKKYGYTSLTFREGDIGGLSAPPIQSWGEENHFDVVICLHACDTATDHALHHAVQWQADLIFAAPCCQHQLNQQIKPKKLSLLTEYGIAQERFCALATDTIRARLLSAVGYKTNLLEFVELTHTPKNLLIRAVRSGKLFPATKKKALSDVQEMIEMFSFEPLLYTLLTREF